MLFVSITLYEFRLASSIFQSIPAHGKCWPKVDVNRIGRFVRQLIIYRFFEELWPRLISRRSTSLVMQDDEDVQSVVHYSLDEMLKAAADCYISLEANPCEPIYRTTRC